MLTCSELYHLPRQYYGQRPSHCYNPGHHITKNLFHWAYPHTQAHQYLGVSCTSQKTDGVASRKQCCIYAKPYDWSIQWLVRDAAAANPMQVSRYEFLHNGTNDPHMRGISSDVPNALLSPVCLIYPPGSCFAVRITMTTPHPRGVGRASAPPSSSPFSAMSASGNFLLHSSIYFFSCLALVSISPNFGLFAAKEPV